jgi:lysophospholipase L1-like esterase
VNRWILTSGAFDGVINFVAAVADPSDPHRLDPAYDSGDHLHPSDAGYRAMANAVDIPALLASTSSLAAAKVPRPQVR